MGQASSGSSWNDCTTSKFRSQLSQWYSYVGKRVGPLGSVLRGWQSTGESANGVPDARVSRTLLPVILGGSR